MKKKILSLLVTGCLLFVPTTAFADDNKTVIKTVDAMLAFSKAVNNGDYDKNKDAVVVLENRSLHTQVHRRIILGTKLTLKSLARTQQRCSSITTPMVLASTNTCMILDLTLLRIFTLTHLSGKRTA